MEPFEHTHTHSQTNFSALNRFYAKSLLKKLSGLTAVGLANTRLTDKACQLITLACIFNFGEFAPSIVP